MSEKASLLYLLLYLYCSTYPLLYLYCSTYPLLYPLLYLLLYLPTALVHASGVQGASPPPSLNVMGGVTLCHTMCPAQGPALSCSAQHDV